ncbi:MAG: hypothetical protein M3Q49_15905 [Actinomycetota bacterium]|nr:hypothetical protein [Actinomycetota bacterium]
MVMSTMLHVNERDSDLKIRTSWPTREDRDLILDPYGTIELSTGEGPARQNITIFLCPSQVRELRDSLTRMLRTAPSDEDLGRDCQAPADS